MMCVCVCVCAYGCLKEGETLIKIMFAICLGCIA